MLVAMFSSRIAAGQETISFILFFSLVLASTMQTENAQADSCISPQCHAPMQSKAYVHQPVLEDECSHCHKKISPIHPNPAAQGFALRHDLSELCYRCHSVFTGSTLHQPVALHACLNCHDPHSSDQPYLLPVGEDLSELCYSCHTRKSLKADADYGHGPVISGYCTYCHSPHASAHDSLLTKSIRDLCLACHVDFINGLANARFVHSAMTESECTSCHQVHGGDEQYLLTRRGDKLCYDCHPGIADIIEEARSVHAVLKSGDQCGNCHMVHYSDNANLLLNDSMQLCFDCHGADASNIGGRAPNIKKEIDNRDVLHGPLADGKCTPCHDPHASSGPMLLKGQYPSGFYAPYDPERYSFCFSCHEEDILSATAEGATDFRNGNNNLHLIHVGDARKGRTCKACHAPHAGENSHLISKSGVAFGDWRVPLRHDANETGGSCVPGCHQKQSYDRVNPVPYPPREDEW